LEVARLCHVVAISRTQISGEALPVFECLFELNDSPARALQMFAAGGELDSGTFYVTGDEVFGTHRYRWCDMSPITRFRLGLITRKHGCPPSRGRYAPQAPPGW